MQSTGAYIAYDPIVEITAPQLLNYTLSDMRTISGSDCYAGGPITFTLVSNDRAYFQYLLRQCQVQFAFDLMVSVFCQCAKSWCVKLVIYSNRFLMPRQLLTTPSHSRSLSSSIIVLVRMTPLS